MDKRLVAYISVFLLVIILLTPVIMNTLKTNNASDKIVINMSDLNSEYEINNFSIDQNDDLDLDTTEENESEDKKLLRNDNTALVEPVLLNGDNIKLIQNETNISLDGQILNRIKNNRHELNTGSYITFKIYTPIKISKKQLENIKVTLPQSGNLTFSEKENKLIKSKNSKAPYFNITLEFMNGQSIPIIIDWGDGKSIIYTFTFNVEVVK